VIDAALRGGREVQTAPIARVRRVGPGARRIETVAGGVEGPARPVTVVFHRGEDHRMVDRVLAGDGGDALGDQLGTDLRLDPRAAQLDDHAGIDGQPGVEPRLGLDEAGHGQDRAGDQDDAALDGCRGRRGWRREHARTVDRRGNRLGHGLRRIGRGKRNGKLARPVTPTVPTTVRPAVVTGVYTGVAVRPPSATRPGGCGPSVCGTYGSGVAVTPNAVTLLMAVAMSCSIASTCRMP